MLHVFAACRRAMLALLLSMTLAPWPTAAGPTVVPTGEGQIGETPGLGDQVLGARFESIRGQAGDVVFGGIFVFGGAMPPPPEARFLTDSIHGTPDPVPVGGTSDLFANIDKVTPASSWSRNAQDDGDVVAFSFAVDGTMPETLTVRIATFDENGDSMADIPLTGDVATFFVPDPLLPRPRSASTTRAGPPSPTPSSPAACRPSRACGSTPPPARSSTRSSRSSARRSPARTSRCSIPPASG